MTLKSSLQSVNGAVKESDVQKMVNQNNTHTHTHTQIRFLFILLSICVISVLFQLGRDSCRGYE